MQMTNCLFKVILTLVATLYMSTIEASGDATVNNRPVIKKHPIVIDSFHIPIKEFPGSAQSFSDQNQGRVALDVSIYARPDESAYL